jgi:hypothetical protein
LDVTIDDGTLLYHNGCEGYWVMAWCYVADEENETTDDGDDTDIPITT